MTLLVLKAHEMYRAGKSLDEVAAWLEENKLRAQAYFIVDDLKYLKRGGRISATAATVGTMLDLKPIISEAPDGTLTANDKIRGRKKAIALCRPRHRRPFRSRHHRPVLHRHKSPGLIFFLSP